ncbi:17352_t:CDS:1, partial [Racocetra persica]
MSSNDNSFVKSEKAKVKKRLYTVTDEPEINDVFEKVNKMIKIQEIENNKIFSKLSDNEKEVLRKEWVDSIVSVIETSCYKLRYLIDDTKIV